MSTASPPIRMLPDWGSETSSACNPCASARDDDRADAAEQLRISVEQPIVELWPVKELVGDLGVRERLVVLLALDDELGVREEEVAATVIGMQVSVDNVGDVGELETDLCESSLGTVVSGFIIGRIVSAFSAPKL